MISLHPRERWPASGTHRLEREAWARPRDLPLELSGTQAPLPLHGHKHGSPAGRERALPLPPVTAADGDHRQHHLRRVHDAHASWLPGRRAPPAPPLQTRKRRQRSEGLREGHPARESWGVASIPAAPAVRSKPQSPGADGITSRPERRKLWVTPSGVPAAQGPMAMSALCIVPSRPLWPLSSWELPIPHGGRSRGQVRGWRGGWIARGGMFLSLGRDRKDGRLCATVDLK